MNDTFTVPRIHILDPILSNQIAAGEVIERPASVVKELLENSLDANAKQITIDLERAGSTLIRVTDSGHGIHPDDMSMALQSHSTSKIHKTSDLASITSLGFRGEALASIASVSRFTLQSCHDSSQQGVSLTFSADQTPVLEPCARPGGTTVEVRNLFFNTPARRKFLRTETTEYLHSISLVKAMALCHFDCAFRMQHNQRSVLNLTIASNNYSKRISEICGRQFLENSQAFDFSREAMRLWGWLGDAEIARSQTDKQYLYINGRYIRDKHINHAIRLAFQDLLYPGRHPSYVIFLELDPAQMDVNVHPGKQEVRFQRTRDVHDFVYSCLNQVLSPNSSSLVDVPMNDISLSSSNNDDTEIHESAEPYASDNTNFRENNNILLRTIFDANNDLPDHNLSLNNRYLITQVKEGFLLIDVFAAREQMVLETLQQQYTKNSVISRPLLMPVDYQNTLDNIDLLEEHSAILSRIGFHYRRTAPERLLIRELPECLRTIQINIFLNDLIALLTKNDSEENLTKTIMKLAASHCNDEMPETLRGTSSGKFSVELPVDERKLLIAYYHQQMKNKSRFKKTLWCVLDDDAIKKILSSH